MGSIKLVLFSERTRRPTLAVGLLSILSMHILKSQNTDTPSGTQTLRRRTLISINKIPAGEAIAFLLEAALKLPKSPFSHLLY